MDRNGNPMITMSRGMCRRNPDLCAFFKADELGHHQLGHFQRNMSVQQAESEADRFAAGHSSGQAVAAAQQFFASGRGGSRVHGTSQQRYARVSGVQAGRAGQASKTRQVGQTSQAEQSAASSYSGQHDSFSGGRQ